ncbi:C40 family peptidase [Clostridium sp. Sa3CVN1]|uniref:C40 family peptidase n=1 Tax=Clostridium cibarium TaxID=2762247 RepID=A0ABR8PSY7_9CLOT|nr:C40 family peptidase [Clostridium cibarium]
MLTCNTRTKKLLIFILSVLLILLNIFNTSLSVKASTISGQAIINEAMKHLGKPYNFGSTGPSSFDCSGFTQYVYINVVNIQIGRTTSNQINSGKEISQSDLILGDLVFTDPGHVGIYIGNGQMIHAPRTGDVVKISSVYKFWRAKRIMETAPNIEDTIFNANFYSNKYADLKSAFGNDNIKLRNHFHSYGIKEGRTSSIVFDSNYYLNHNADLINAFGANNFEAAYNHFINTGYKESRDLSPVFNMDFYIKNNPDVANSFGNDYHGIIIHFLTYGINEGRTASENFNFKIYKNNYKDLESAFGNNNLAYYEHYLLYGIKEGRVAK